MRQLAIMIAVPLFLAACGRSDEEALEDAANQSTPAAAEVLNGAAENGMEPQEALELAGEVAANTDQANSTSGNLRARPNTVQQPNPAQPGQPVESLPANQIQPPSQR